MLARKREVNGKLATKSYNYYVVRTKLQRDYRKVANIQNDLLQKFTTNLVDDYDQIVMFDTLIKLLQFSWQNIDLSICVIKVTDIDINCCLLMSFRFSQCLEELL